MKVCHLAKLVLPTVLSTPPSSMTVDKNFQMQTEKKVKVVPDIFFSYLASKMIDVRNQAYFLNDIAVCTHYSSCFVGERIDLDFHFVYILFIHESLLCQACRAAPKFQFHKFIANAFWRHQLEQNTNRLMIETPVLLSTIQ